MSNVTVMVDGHAKWLHNTARDMVKLARDCTNLDSQKRPSITKV